MWISGLVAVPPPSAGKPTNKLVSERLNLGRSRGRGATNM